jgi:hypothetical protein
MKPLSLRTLRSRRGHRGSETYGVPDPSFDNYTAVARQRMGNMDRLPLAERKHIWEHNRKFTHVSGTEQERLRKRAGLPPEEEA